MSFNEFSGIIVLVSISFGFYFTGYNIKLFTALFSVVLCIYVVLLSWSSTSSIMPGEILLTISGFIFFFFGLLIVRAVIKRSVSLHLVISPSKEPTVSLMKMNMKNRIREIEKYLLGFQQDGVIKLTLLGKCFGYILGFLYMSFGMRR